MNDEHDKTDQDRIGRDETRPDDRPGDEVSQLSIVDQMFSDDPRLTGMAADQMFGLG